MTNSSGKEKEEIDSAHVICLMYELISSSRDSDDLSIGFHRSNEARERELTDNKTTTGKYHVSIYLKDVFGFAEHQDNCTYGLGYKETIQNKSDNHVVTPRAGTNAESLALAGKVFIDDISQYVPHYTPKLSNQKTMLGHIGYKAATKMSYFKKHLI